MAIQVFPQNLLKPTYQDPITKQIKGRSELECRGQYIDILQKKFGQHHSLAVLIKGCLDYVLVKRPTAIQALERLGEMRATVHDPYSDLDRLQLEKSLTEKEAEVQQIPLLRSELEQLTVSCMLECMWLINGTTVAHPVGTYIYKYEKHFPKMYGDVGMAVPKTTQTRHMDGCVQATQRTTQVTPSLYHFSFLLCAQSCFQYSDNRA